MYILPPRGVLNKVLCGDALPKVQTPSLLYTVFDREGNSFIYLP